MKKNITLITILLMFAAMFSSCGEESNDPTSPATSNPTADFSFSFSAGSEAPAQVVFTNTSQNADLYSWDFGDGETSTQLNPVHVFSSSGSYTVALTAENVSSGQTDTKSRTVTVTLAPEPVADFTFTFEGSATVPATVQFDNTSQNADVYNWDFGNGQNSDEEDPSATFSTAGTFTVTLIAQNSVSHQADTTTKDLTIAPPDPVADFLFAGDTLVNSVISFINLSTNADAYQWDFGNGSTSSDEEPTTSYVQSGTFTIQLIASNSSTDKTDTTSKEISIFLPDPVSNFRFSGGRVTPASISFINESENADAFSWDFGDGRTSIQENPNMTFDVHGTHTITLIARQNETGKSDTTQKELVITPGTVTMTGWQIWQIPFLTEGGAGWDNNDGPDLFTIISDRTNEYSNTENNRHEDLVPENLPVGWTFNEPLSLTNWSNTYTIEVWDYDLLTSNDFIGSASFGINAVIQSAGYVESFRFSNGDIELEIFLQWE